MIGWDVAAKELFQGRNEILRHRAADAPVRQFHHVIVVAAFDSASLEDFAIDAKVAELVDDERDPPSGGVLEHVADQRGLPCAEETGDDRCGDLCSHLSCSSPGPPPGIGVSRCMAGLLARGSVRSSGLPGRAQWPSQESAHRSQSRGRLRLRGLRCGSVPTAFPFHPRCVLHPSGNHTTVVMGCRARGVKVYSDRRRAVCVSHSNRSCVSSGD